MSFGFGVGDFVTVCSLTLKLYNAFKNAPEEFSEISRELHSFHIVAADLMDQAGDANSSLNKHATARRLELIALRDNLVATMEELQDLHQRYQRMGRISWSRFSLGQQDLAAMRSKLTVQISAVNAFVGSLNMATLGRMEPMLERIFRLLDERAKGNIDVAQSVLSVKTEDEENGASWAMLEMDLRTEGIPQQYIQENKDRIMEVVCSVVELNHLDGTEGGTVYANDSVSQIGRLPSQGPGRSPPRPRKPTPMSISTTKLRFAKSEASKTQIPPYQDWVKSLSPEQEAARIKLMNYGFDLRNLSIQTPSRLSIFGFLLKSNLVQEKAVCWAAKRGEIMALRMLLQRGCSPSSKQDGIPATVLAAEAERWDTVGLLITSGADVQAGYISGLREDGRVDSNPKTGDTGARGLIQLAAMWNNTDVLTLLLDKGTNINVRVKPSTRLVSIGKDDPIYERREHFSWTALHLATKTGSLEATKLLLARGASVNQTTLRGDTALHFAITYAAAHAAVEPQESHSSEHGGSISRSHKIIRLLLDSGANVNASSSFVSTPLHLAISSTREDLCQILLESGADANTLDIKQITPLHRVIDVHSSALVLRKYHKEHGGPFDVKPAKYYQVYDVMVKILLDYGAEVNQKTKRQTPLEFAARYRLYATAKLLIDRGADITFVWNTSDTKLKRLFPNSPLPET